MYSCLIVLIIMIVFPFFSIITFLSGLKHIDISLNLSDKRISSGDIFTIGIKTKNTSIITYLKAIVITDFENTYYEYTSSLKSVIPIKAKSEFLHHISFDVSRLGIVNVTCKSVEVEDLCGFICCVFNLDLNDSVTIVPPEIMLEENVYTGLFGGLSDNEDDTKKGNEYSDTSNIREYVPGDRIKDIHWKLSAKKDILLVKDRIKSCENQMVVWFDSSSNPNLNDKILMLYLAIIRHCVSEGILVKALFWDYHINKTISFAVNSYAECYECLEAIYKCGIGYRTNDIRNLIYYENYDVHNFVKIGYYDNIIKAVVEDEA